MADSLKSQAVKGVVWSAVERFSVQGIQFVLSIIIARLVAPSEYGLIAMLGIFLAVAQTFIDSGFSNALIQKKDRTEVDFSTVFYFNIVVALVAYLLLFLSAPYIAFFYKEPLLDAVVKWVGVGIVISSFSITQRTKLTIQLDFKTQAKASLFSVILSGSVGVFLAYCGYGVWALVSQSLVGSFFNTCFLWMFTRWMPFGAFSIVSFRSLLAFGSRIFLSGLLHTIYLNLYTLVIGRRYSATTVGYYNRAYSMVQYPSTNIVVIITRAIFPMQCELQDDEEHLNAFFVKYLKMSCYIVFPLMVGFAVLSKPLVLLILTDKWIYIENLISILCIAYMFYPIMVINVQMLMVKGHSALYLKAEIIKKILAICILIVTMPLGVEILCIGIIVYNLLDCIIVIYFVKKVFSTSYTLQIMQLYPILFLNIVMGVVIYFCMQLFMSPFLQLIFGFFGGALSYFLLSYVLHYEELFLLIKNLRLKI